MSEPSDDPAIPTNVSSPHAASSASGAPLQPGPRNNPPTAASKGTNPSQISLDDLVSLAKSILSTRDSHKEGPVEANAAAAGGRTRIPKSQKKFRRRDPDPDRQPRVGEEGDWEEEAVAPVPFGPAPQGVTRVRRPRSDLRRLSDRYALPTAVGLVVGACLTLYVSRHIPAASPGSAARRPGADTGAAGRAAGPSMTTMQLLDEAMAAEKSRDFRRAIELLGQVQHGDPALAGVEYQLGVASARQGDMGRAVVYLNKSIEAGQNPAKSYVTLGSLMSGAGKIEVAIGDFESATKADPFNARGFFLWGEALRRVGQPLAALTRLTQAVDRASDPGEVELYEFKRRLALIEMDRQAELTGELNAKLALDPVPSYWLLTAAAVNMRDGHYDRAAEYLERVSHMLPAGELSAQLHDYFLYSFAGEKTFAKYFEPPVAPGAYPGLPMPPSSAAAGGPPSPGAKPSPAPAR